MKNSRREGIILHRLIRTMEELSSGLQNRGATKKRADSQALIAALILEDWPRQEAEEYARTYFGEQT